MPGHPDWQPAPTETLGIVRTFQQIGTGVDAVWTPAAGKRIRLQGYHISLAAVVVGGTNGGTVRINVQLRQQLDPIVIDQWTAVRRVKADGIANMDVESRLPALPGVGLRFASAGSALLLDSSATTTNTAEVDIFRVWVQAYGLEE